MKKIFIAVILIIAVNSSYACNICGCGGGNTYMGLMPNFKNHFFGLRYNYASFHTQLLNDPTQFSNNYYNSVEVWGGINISQKFRVMGFVPYYINKQVDDDGIMSKNGLGDITLIAQYQFFHSFSLLPNHKSMEQQLWLGGGIKAPTGSFKQNPNDTTTTVADINAQLGTGSTDFILNGLYSIRVGSYGLNLSANYKFNTLNSDHYQYGNKFTANAIAYYRFNNKRNTITPNAGLGYETVKGNRLNGTEVQFTGSHVTTGLVGLEFNFSSVGIGLNAQIPIQQSFAEGQTTMKMRGMAHITFTL